MSQTGGLAIPGMNTSAITNAVASAIQANPAVQQVTSVGEKITSLGNKLADVKQEAVNAVTKAAGDKVTESLAAAGITPAGAASGADEGTPEDTANDEGTNEEATNEEGSEEATNEEGSEEATNEEGSEEATNEEGSEEATNEQTGGARYQIILLERPIQDRLFVCYDDGTPIYFTKNSKNKAKLFDPKKKTRKARR